MIRVTVYNEGLHEKTSDSVRAVYPEGIHGALKKGLESDEISVRTVTLDDLPDGLTPAGAGRDRRADLVGPHGARESARRSGGSGAAVACWRAWARSSCIPAIIPSLSARLMGTTCNLTWREDAEQ